MSPRLTANLGLGLSAVVLACSMGVLVARAVAPDTGAAGSAQDTIAANVAVGNASSVPSISMQSQVASGQLMAVASRDSR